MVKASMLFKKVILIAFLKAYERYLIVLAKEYRSSFTSYKVVSYEFPASTPQSSYDFLIKALLGQTTS